MCAQIRFWIYGRISELEKYELFTYQIDMLSQYTHENNFATAGSTKAFDSGKSLKSFFMQCPINSIISELINCILFHSTNRLLIDSEKIEELELIRRMQNVSNITLK